MNSATVSPVNIHATCKCGHDRGLHTSTTCTGCLTSGGAHNHAFTGKNETWPSTAFPTNEPEGYFCAGGLGTYGPQTATTGAGNTAGATTVTLSTNVGAVVGGDLLLQNSGSPQNGEYYRIRRLIGTTQVQIDAPGLLFTYAAGTAATFLGDGGSMSGANRPANGQRGG